jgi:hypothetical protein
LLKTPLLRTGNHWSSGGVFLQWKVEVRELGVGRIPGWRKAPLVVGQWETNSGTEVVFSSAVRIEGAPFLDDLTPSGVAKVSQLENFNFPLPENSATQNYGE